MLNKFTGKNVLKFTGRKAVGEISLIGKEGRKIIEKVIASTDYDLIKYIKQKMIITKSL